MENKIAILIPVFNGLSFTKQCLYEINKLLTKDELNCYFETIVIDDGSTDGSSEWIEKNYPEVAITKGDGNLWWSGGINKGVEHVLKKNTCNYILWWNNDIRPDDDYFIKLYKLIAEQNDPKLIIGSKILYKGTNIIWGMGGIFNTKTGRRHQLNQNVEDSSKYNQIMDVQWLPGMGSTMHISVYQEIGMLDDKNFPQYHGDIDYIFRAWLKGYSIKVFPQLKIWNDAENTGLKNDGTFKRMKEILTSHKSLYNLKTDIIFYKKFITSPVAYYHLFIKYLVFFGGFFKWKVLSIFRINKKKRLY